VAIEVQKIDPIDLQPRKAVGFNLPFSSNSVFTMNYETKTAIKYNLINLILTGVGERYLNPEFGTTVRNKLFEQVTQDTLSDVEFSIRRSVSIHFQKVEILNCKATAIPDSNQIQIYFRYKVKDTFIEDELVVNI
jgi:phage baseplate assembly protein W